MWTTCASTMRRFSTHGWKKTARRSDSSIFLGRISPHSHKPVARFIGDMMYGIMAEGAARVHIEISFCFILKSLTPMSTYHHPTITQQNRRNSRHNHNLSKDPSPLIPSHSFPDKSKDKIFRIEISFCLIARYRTPMSMHHQTTITV